MSVCPGWTICPRVRDCPIAFKRLRRFVQSRKIAENWVSRCATDLSMPVMASTQNLKNRVLLSLHA
eukprot:493744-Amphidinium_carterae.1